MEHRDVRIDDALSLHAELSGEGAPLVLLHGFTGSAGSWSTVRELLEPGRRVVAVDLPGHGRSSAPPSASRYALPRLADDVARLLDALALERVALLGYSLGGRAALHFALRHADRLTALVLESASPGIADEGERTQRVASDEALAESLEREGITAFVDRWEALPLWESQRALPAPVRAALRARRLAGDARGLANSLRGAGAGAEPSVAGELKALRVPTLVVAGSLDTKYVAIGHELAGAIPGARLAVVEGAGHAVHLERPGELAALVRDFPDDAGR